MYACNVKSFVYYEHHSNDYVVEHSHNCYECVFYLEGKGTVTADNDVLEYDGPTITLVSPSIKHDEKTKEFSRLYIILFEMTDFERLKPFTSLKLNDETYSVFLDLFDKMREEEKEKKALYKNIVNSYFGLIMGKYLRSVSAARESHDKELVIRIKNYIKENYNQDIDFERIAMSFGYSYDRFRHIFQKETGTSIHQYLLNCKLYAAKQMLISTDLQVKDIAVKCGFNSSIHFNNFFKKRMNISPQQFRKFSFDPFDVGVFKIEDSSVKQRKKIFIDTDIGGDCDDAGAIALANIFKNDGLIDIAGMTFTTSAVYGPACIDAINTYYGNGDVQIGATSRKNYCDKIVNRFQRVLATEFSNGIYDKDSDTLAPAPDAVKFIRKKLSDSSDRSVTFVCIGQLDNVSDLLDSCADEYSPLDGTELVKQKVKEFVVMGGLFKEIGEEVVFCGNSYETEYNIVTDVESARNFVSKCPVKIVFSDFKVGCQVLTGKTLLDNGDLGNPVTVAYKLFQNKPRESWDLLTMWYAVFGADDLFEVSQEGSVTVDETGRTFFDCETKSDHYYIRLNNSVEYTQDKIDQTLLKGDIYEK